MLTTISVGRLFSKEEVREGRRTTQSPVEQGPRSGFLSGGLKGMNGHLSICAKIFRASRGIRSRK